MKNYLRSKTTGKSAKAGLPFKVLGFVFLLITMAGVTGWAQSSGDYRSASTGNWKTLTTWQRYNGSSWASPTTAQGWPGQFAGTGTVTIQSGHVITISNTGISTQAFPSLQINTTGRLYLTGSNATVTFTLASSLLNIASGGDLYMYNKTKLVLATDAAITMVPYSNSIIAEPCNNNAEIYIGSQKFAACAGAPGDIFSFDQLMAGGGTLNAIPTSNSPICQGSTISLTGNHGGAAGSSTTYTWSVTAPGGGITTYSSQNVSIPSAVTGTYSAKLTITTNYNGTIYTNSETIPVVVNPLPTLSGASQSITVCDGSPATITLTGLLPNTTFSLNYSINSVAQPAITGLIANASGYSSFITTNLSAANNGQILQITGISVTSSSTNCPQSFTRNVTLSVWTSGSGTWTGATNTDWNTASNWCGGVPTSTTDVYIPAASASVPNQPLIGTAGGVCHNITIEAGASLTIAGSNTLDVKGNWTNNGIFTPNTGTVSFSGSSAAQTIGGSGTNAFYNLTINNSYSGGGVKAGSNIAVNGVLNLAAANSSSGVGALEMVMDYNGYPGSTTTNPIVSYILTMGGNATTIGQGDVTGKIFRNSLTANTAYTFGNPYTTYAYTVAPTDVTVTVTIGTAYGSAGVWGYPNSVKRSYEMVPSGGGGGKVAMNLHYLDSELNGNTESSLTTGDYDIGDGQPLGDEHGRSSYDYANNYIGLSGVPVEYFQYNATTHNWRTVFNLHDYFTSHTVWDGSESSSWMNDLNWSNGIPGDHMTAIIPDAASTPNDPVLAPGQIIGGIQILSGGILDLNNQTITLAGYNYNGWEDQSGISDYAGSTVILTNSDPAYPIPVLGMPHFDNLTINAGANVTFQLNSHIYISGTFTNNGTLNAETFENTVEFNGTSQTVIAPLDNEYYHLSLSGSGTKTLPSTLTASQNFTLTGSAVTSGTTLNIGGNFTNSSSGSLSVTNVNLNGVTTQTIGGTSSTTFTNLALNNASGATLSNSESVSGTLDLVNGLLTTSGSNLLTIGCDGSITNASSSGYINGPLARAFCSTSSKDFPIGKGGNYRMMTLNYTALSGTSTVTAEQFEETIPGTSFPANTTYQADRYWSVVQSGGSAFTYNITLNGSPFTPGTGAAKILKGDGSANVALDATFSSPGYTASGITSFSNFAVATECLAPSITSAPAPASTCDESGTPQFTVAASGDGLSYQWEESATGTGGTFYPVVDGGIYSNATTSTLTITAPTYSMNGYAYRVVISRDCGSNVISDAATLTVNPVPAITLGTSPSACSGSVLADLAYSVTSGSPDQYSIDYDADANTAGFIDVSFTALPSSPIVLSTPSAEGTYNGILYVKNSSGCQSAGYPFTITIIPLPQGTLVGNTICGYGTGQLTWNATSGTAPFTVVYNDGLADRTVTNVTSGTPFDVYTNPTVTSSYALVSVTGAWCSRTNGFTGGNASITVLNSASVTWNGNTSEDWNTSANWSDGYIPTSCTDVIIPPGLTNYPTLNSEGICQNLTIHSGASLLDNGYLTVLGNTTVERSIAGNEWHFISSPLTSTLSGTFTGMYLQSFEESNSTYHDIIPVDVPLTVGTGYALWNNATFIAAFEGGNLNTGSYSLTTTQSGEGWNLIGNPYPSSINWDATTGWTKANVDNATYTHVNASTWASYVGGIGNNGGSPYIAPCQGFFVKATALGFLGMTDAVRVHNATSFFKNSAATAPDMVRLEVSGNGYTDEAVVRLHPASTSAFDGDWDAFKLYGDVEEAAQIYTLGDSPLAINAIPEAVPVHVGLHAAKSGTYTIAATKINNLSDVKLEDSKTGMITTLSDNSYTFSWEAGENENRFILRFAAVGTPEPDMEKEISSIYSYNKTVIVDLSANISGDVYIYTSAGQLVASDISVSGQVRKDLTATGIYMVQVVTPKDTITRKVWIK